MLNYETIPNQAMVGGIKLYIERGIMPGGFLTALLSNDLMGAFGAADQTNINCMYKWATWLYNEMPSRGSGMWGSLKDMQNYCRLVNEKLEANK